MNHTGKSREIDLQTRYAIFLLLSLSLSLRNITSPRRDFLTRSTVAVSSVICREFPGITDN